MSGGFQKFDHAGHAVNQAAIIILLLLAFIINIPWLVILVALAMLLGTVFNCPGFGFVYTSILKPLDWVKPNVYDDNPEPHRFAQGFGGAIVTASLIAFWLGSPISGWILAWVVITLASLNLFNGFCAGCAVYYWLNQLNVPGFVRPSPDGRFPGLHPKL